MSLRNIFNQIVSQLGNAEIKCIPISNFLMKYPFEQCNTISDDEVYRVRLQKGEDEICAFIVSHNHNKTGSLKLDTNHNYIELYENGELVDSRNYMYKDR